MQISVLLSLLFGHQIVSDSLWPHCPQHARPPCLSPVLSRPEFTQVHIYWICDFIQPSHPLSSLSPPEFNLSQHQGLFQRVGSSHSGGQSIGASASASVLPMNIQDLFLLGLTGLIFLQSKGLSRVFTFQRYQFFDAQPSLWSNAHICTWLLKKP